MLHGTFTNEIHRIDEHGHDGLLFMGIANTFVTNGTTLVHTTHEFVGKFMMVQCDVDSFYSFILKQNLFVKFQA